MNVSFSKTIATATLLGFTLCAQSAVVDAFQGILPVTDPTMMHSLNGDWSLKVVEGISNDLTVPPVDDSWGTIPVPGCWEAYGYARPSYGQPPALTGYYRTTFTIPDYWKGQLVALRLDGVLYGYDLWVNGRHAGSWRSAYNTALFDITPFLNPKQQRQELALRVITQFPGSDFDCNDDWSPCGIFRDVTLMAVPKTHLKDLTVRTKLTGEVDIQTELANASKDTELRYEVLDSQGVTVGNATNGQTLHIDSPHLWTAETPYLYTLRTTLLKKGQALQTFEHKFGFRELTIDDKVIKLNGQPIKFRGVTCHATDPKTVKVISDELTLKDMRLMKEAGINYIRTSHYPREPRFYELADSLGFYVIDEVPFGYGDKNLEKEEFYPVLQQRAQATIRRDKNHASVLIWSLGNENPLTDICIRLGDYVKQELDPSRPICYPQIGSYFRNFNYDFPKVADIYTPHYPTTNQLGDFYQRADRPVIFTEYLHTLGISFEDHDRQWEIIERTPWLAGGSVWEWVDQGMPFRTELDDCYGYEERVFTSKHGGFEMNGNKGTDGLLYADRTPLPNYYELQHNYAQTFVNSATRSGETVSLSLRNRYDFINLKDNVTFSWTLTNNGDTIRQGAFSPDCPPHDSVKYNLHLPAQNGLSLLLFDIKDAHRNTLLHQSFVLNKPEMTWTSMGDPMEAVQAWPLVRVGRKPTMAENLKVKDRRISQYLQPIDNPYVKATLQTTDCGDAIKVSYTLSADTTDTFFSELGIAMLLDKSIDRVQWVGYGPFATYPGRRQANNYGIWSKQKDDLYFEGNRMGVDAALFSDSNGNGILVAGDNLNLNFEQTDRGIVVTVNAAVSGQGPKFSTTAFPVISREVGTLSGEFMLYRVSDGQRLPLFNDAKNVPEPLHPFEKQYDTYLMRYEVPSMSTGASQK